MATPKLVVDSFKYILDEWRLLLGLSLVYALATYFFLGGISQADFIDLKEATLQVFQGNLDSLSSAFNLFSSAMSGVLSQPLNELQQLVALLISFMFWLSLVWALRMRFAGEKIKIRDSIYNSAAPFVPSLLILVTIAIQLLPAALGLLILVLAQSTGALHAGVEYMMFAAVAALLCVMSLYWVVSSALSLIVVTLPKMYPWQALSTASQLVVGQRWRLIFRVIVLALVLGVGWAAVFIPTLLLDSWLKFDWLPLVPVVAQALSALTITYSAVYIYKLYRSLL